MSKIKGQKLYILLSEFQIIGVWSNLSVLVRESLIESDEKASLYMKIYRLLKKHTEGGQPIETFNYEFSDANGKTYQIKIEILK